MKRVSGNVLNLYFEIAVYPRRSWMALQEFGSEGNGTSRSRVERVFKRLRLCMEAEHSCTTWGPERRHVNRASQLRGRISLLSPFALASRMHRGCVGDAVADEVWERLLYHEADAGVRRACNVYHSGQFQPRRSTSRL